MKTTNFNWTKIIPYVVILLLLGTTFYFYSRSSNFKDKYKTEVKLGKALIDTITTYKNKYNEIVVEKRTLQSNIKELKNMNDYLSDNQQELIKRIKSLENKYSIIAAALIQTNVILDSLRDGNVIVDTTENKIIITDSLPDIEYSFEIRKVRPSFSSEKPVFIIKRLFLPNTQFIEFHWKNERKEGYPVSFSVSNSNKYFETVDIDSYIIPEIEKQKIKPNFWQKLGNTGKKTVPYLIGGAIGATTVYLFSR